MENNRLIEQYLYRAKHETGFTGEDLVGIFVPVLLQLEKLHAQDQVGLYRGLESFTENANHRLRIDENQAVKSLVNLEKINRILPKESKSFDVVSEQELLKDLSNNREEISDKNLVEKIDDQIVAPVFVPAYKSYETLLRHHDPLTDIHVLGMIMASLAFSLDLRNFEDLKVLDAILKNPGYAPGKVHPNIMKLIIDMLQLDRRKRIRDVYTVRIRLENYLEYSYNTQEDLNLALEHQQPGRENRHKWILTKLRNRLFDLSRRNKMIYYKKSSRYVNLTLSSVPYVLDYHNIRPEKLILWNNDVAGALKKAGKIKLNRYLQFKDNPQIAISLKKVYYEANRDTAEYGFNQLKLAFAFLNWYNFKENPNEKIQSPLLLLPVRLKKRKGINDDFVMEIPETEALVNPVLAHYLKELFNIELPKSYDLSEVDMQDIFADINRCITSKSNEVSLNYVDKPKLRIIHSQAKRSFEAYQKKVKKNRSKVIWKAHGEYSYRADDYRPFGIKLFKNQVKKYSSLIEFLIDPDIQINQSAVEKTVHRDFFQIESDGTINPYIWEFDLCNFTLGNFNYQKMTLAHDYDQIIAQNIENSVFAKLFSDEPREIFKPGDDFFDIKDNYCVIPADATQLGAIKASGQTGSYIIQGPPGTGKSQTIVNLIANEVAQNKSVLFISEKRAALDVVYARMSQIGLKDICTLIHDSQTDKKPFIQDLKYTYQAYTGQPNEWRKIAGKREAIINKLQKYIDVLQGFHQYQRYAENQISVRQIVDLLINNNFDASQYPPVFYENAPGYELWLQHGENLLQIEKTLTLRSDYRYIADCPYFHLHSDVASQLSIDFITQSSTRFETELAELTTKLNKYLSLNISGFDEIQPLMQSLSHLGKLYRQNLLDLLHPESETAQTYRRRQEEIKNWQDKIKKVEEKNRFWTQKPRPEELKRLLQEHKEVSGGFFNKLWGKKEEFHKKISRFYDFDSQLVPPGIDEILSDLATEYQYKSTLEKMLSDDGYINKISSDELSLARRELQKLEQITGRFGLLTQPAFQELLAGLPELETVYESLLILKNQLAPGMDDIDALFDHIDELRLHTSLLYQLVPSLKEWFEIDEELRRFVLKNKLKVSQIEFISAYKQLLLASRQSGSQINGSELQRVVEQIRRYYPELLKINSKYIHETVKKKFQSALDLAFMPVYEMTDEQKIKKKQYDQGRAILENEFNKKIRYKSIRDLSAEDSGVIIKDLKPVWMMSPLSVSDTLPLIENFDVVIFDEASQITVEEGIPPLFRANKAIIVGDEMQMPPSNFFSTKIEEDDDDEAEFLSMDAESLLNQGVRKLPQVMLGWHYRSRQEALINYSNFAFYQGKLYTIPDVYTPHSEHSDIEVYQAEDAKQNKELIFQNSITYHYLPNGVYDNRMNDDEAEYIAELVREILLSKTDKSLGIVAFSMQQQSNIERALNQLAQKDRKFAMALEEAFAGNQTEEFTGLFIKNLENVQGDERDIMILSICYGYNPKGKMLMNFGPINRRGGEKRLNVIFSRAKHHMVVVSSIKHHDITNEYNEGANHLKRYLQYSEYISTGQTEAAQTILHSIGRIGLDEQEESRQKWLDEIKQFLEQKGYYVKAGLGQSKLKIDLGIKKDENQETYDLGIIIDHKTQYKNRDVLSQYYAIPHILEVFGWQIYKIYAYDWLNNSEIIKENIIDILENRIQEEPALDEADLPEVFPENEAYPEAEQETVSAGEPLEEKKLVHPAKQKFYHISRQGKTVYVRMGKTGEEDKATGFPNTFGSEAEAQEFYETQIKSRMARGFEELENTGQ